MFTQTPFLDRKAESQGTRILFQPAEDSDVSAFHEINVVVVFSCVASGFDIGLVIDSPAMGTLRLAPTVIEKKFSWKRLFIKAVGFGTGFALMGTLIVGGVVWYINRPKPPKPWDKDAIKASFWNVTLDDDSKITARFQIVNNTDLGYTLEPTSATISMEMNDTKILAPVGKFAGSQSEAFIPPGRSAIISINTQIEYKGPDLSDFRLMRKGHI